MTLNRWEYDGPGCFAMALGVGTADRLSAGNISRARLGSRAALRSDGHEVYDFKGPGDGWGEQGGGPGGFHWKECAHPGTDWQRWTIAEYLEALEHPRAEEGFRRDMDALEQCDICIMVMPCGPSASMEMGWACGAKKDVYVYVPGLREPDLMVKMAGLVTEDLDLIRSAIYATVNP